MASHNPIASPCKLMTIVILIIFQTNLLFAEAVDDDDANMLPLRPISREQEVEEPCHLEPAFERLRTIIPRDLHPEALQSASCGFVNEENQNIWPCPESETFDLHRSDFYLGLHCEDLELLFSLYNAVELARHPEDVFGFDYQSWCKCQNASNPKVNTCDCILCNNGMKMKQGFHNSIFNDDTADEPRFQLTCSEAAEYARHITNEERCQDTLEQARAFCCETQSPASSPTSESDPITSKNQDAISPGDVSLTLTLFFLVTGFSSLLVHGSLRAMEFIDDRWFSWEDM